MMKRTIPLCLCAALALTSSPARAIYMTAKDLMRKCLSDAPQDMQECVGYVEGVIDYHVMMQSLGTAPTIDFCLPEGVTGSQATVTVMKYLQRAPQNGDFIAAPAVTLALHERYPCAAPGRRRK
jgi:hypothetical protein